MQLTHPKLKTINGPTISTPMSPTHTYKKDINIATCLYTLYVNLAFKLLEMSKLKKNCQNYFSQAELSPQAKTGNKKRGESIA